MVMGQSYYPISSSQKGDELVRGSDGATVILDQLPIRSDEKDQVREVVTAVAEEGTRRTGSRNITVVVNQSDEQVSKIVVETKRRKDASRLWEKIDGLELCIEARALLRTLDNNRKLTIHKTGKLVRANKMHPLNQFSSEQQLTLVQKLLLEPVSVTDTSDADLIQCVLQKGYADERGIRKWFAALIPALERILFWLDVPPETYGRLSLDQRNQLASLLALLCKQEEVVRPE